MRTSFAVLALFLQSAAAVGCFAADTESPPSIGYFEAIAQEAAPVVGETYHLRHCIMHEDGQHVATNYWKGALVPINTKVTLVSLKGKALKLKVVETGEQVEVVNVPGFTKKDMPTIARNMLTRTPVPLDSFNADTVRNIKNGMLAVGMTREQVVMARGYPPSHRTSSLDNDVWTYWVNRFANFAYTFENGRLVSGHDLG